eukprot:scaffold5104_cov28-Tisochrysis_lutea.AAC.2
MFGGRDAGSTFHFVPTPNKEAKVDGGCRLAAASPADSKERAVGSLFALTGDTVGTSCSVGCDERGTDELPEGGTSPRLYEARVIREGEARRGRGGGADEK